jgi:uncharacterized protein
MASPTSVVSQFFTKFAEADIDAAIGVMAPEVDWVPAMNLPWSRGSYHGPEDVKDHLQSFTAALFEGAATPERYLESGDEVVVLGTGSGRARSTGRSFSVPFAFVFAVSGGKVTSLRGHVDTATIRDAFAPDSA